MRSKRHRSKYHRVKIHGFVETVGPETFWARIWTVDDRDREYEAEFLNEKWPASSDYPKPKEGVYLSMPARSDQHLQIVKVGRWTKREILDAQREARETLKHWRKIGLIPEETTP